MIDNMRIYSRADVDRMVAAHLSAQADSELIWIDAAAISGAIMGWIANSLFHLAGWL